MTFQNKFAIVLLLILLSNCDSKEIKLNSRNYRFDSSIEKKQAESVAIQIDSILLDKNLSKISADTIYISKNDSIVIISFIQNDTIIHYLRPYYQAFTNSVGYNISNKNVTTQIYNNDIEIATFDHEDSIIYAIGRHWQVDKKGNIELMVMNPITANQADKIMDHMDYIIGYIAYETDSAFSKIYLERNKVLLEIPFKDNQRIDKNEAKIFKHTANLISDSVFWSWPTEIRLLNDKGKIMRTFHDVDTLYVIN